MIWTQIAASRTFRAYDSGDYRVVVGTGSDWQLTFRNSRLGTFDSMPAAHGVAMAHRRLADNAAAALRAYAGA